MRKSKTETTCNIVNTLYKKSGPVTKRKRTIKKTFRTNKGTKSFFHTIDLDKKEIKSCGPAKVCEVRQVPQKSMLEATKKLMKAINAKTGVAKKLDKASAQIEKEIKLNSPLKVYKAIQNDARQVPIVKSVINKSTSSKKIDPFEQKKLSDHRVGHKKYKVEHKKINNQYIPKFDLSDIDQEIIDFIDDN